MSGAGVTGGRNRCARLSAMWAMMGLENGCLSTARSGLSKSGHV